MSIYDINYDTKAVEWLPPDKRYPRMVGFVRALLNEVKYLADKILTRYRLGATYQPYSHNYSYFVGDLVVQKQVVYESLTDGNITAPPSASWQVYLPSFIGVNDRVKFNGIKLTLEYALNIRFGTNFRQPVTGGSYAVYDASGSTEYIPGNIVTYSGNAYLCTAVTSGTFVPASWHAFSPYPVYNSASSYVPQQVVSYSGHYYVCQAATTGAFNSSNWVMEVLYPHVSDIYITSTPYIITGFNVGYTTGSSVGKTLSSQDIGPSSVFSQQYMFNIMIPLAVYNTLNLNQGADAEITGFVLPLCPTGTTFKITTY